MYAADIYNLMDHERILPKECMHGLFLERFHNHEKACIICIGTSKHDDAFFKKLIHKCGML